MGVRRCLALLLAAAAVAGCAGNGSRAPEPSPAAPPSATPATSAAPDATPTQRSAPTVEITIVGDLMLTRGVPDAAAALAPMSDRLRRADLTLGNLEMTLSTAGAPTQGGDSFGAGPAVLDPLRRAGFDALSLANNHLGDYGERAMLDSLATLRDGPIAPFGLGRDLRSASRPAFVEAKGVRFALVGFNAIGETPRATPQQAGALSVRMPPRTGPLREADLAHVARVVRRADHNADAVIVLPHWGTQYTHRPEPIQRRVARRLVAAGADLVVGGHPHWVQGVESVRGVPVVHSLGNFVFDMDFMTETMQGVVLETTWRGGELRGVDFVPYRLDTETFAPRVVRGSVAADILDDVRRTSSGRWAP